MVVKITLIDNLYKNILDFCKTNGLDIKKYMSEAIIERYNLDRYGDLNEKIVNKKEEDKKILEPNKNEETDISVKERVIENPSFITDRDTLSQNINVKVTSEEKKTKRTLKSK